LSLPEFKLLRPRTVEEAVGYLDQHSGRIRVLAGGTDLIPSMRQKLFEPEYVLDLRGIAALRGINPQADGGVEIGALTSIRSIERSEFLRQHFPVLSEAATAVASPTLRNMGTIGGNICLDTR
jgi:4-hydroxybenzoyl-CoA reductase subunit beta